MMRIILIILIFFFSLTVKAENLTAIAMEAEKHKTENMQNYLQFAEEAKRNEKNIVSHYKNELSSMNANITPIQNVNLLKNENNPNVIIFISFSIPEQSIVSLLQDAKKLHASVVIRGLIHNSFKETFIKMASIVKKAGGGGVELNPPVFKKFDIQKVPAIVVLPTSQTCYSQKICSEDKFDVVYGDIPLFNALKTIRDHGTVSKKSAEQLVLSWEESFHA